VDLNILRCPHGNLKVLAMRAKPGKRGGKNNRKTRENAEILHDALENPIFSNPIDENTV
jgi:hypothetical protein